ncbi:hypothetical protein NDU88_005253 [Pleurodeles waltl]|uniref:Endonuclease/exonuclease/phosphatase domain-containing protein n=1 Tax=Pleurodeles waltl TaxID=8319 RepID=A0AAV7ULJ9_PLEWA|nr:hypothetical protein NDU88_005253 [Pleurodeles waltl]
MEAPDSHRLKLCSWNIHGLKNKLQDPDTLTYLQGFSIIALQKTWALGPISIPGYTYAVLSTTKEGKCGRGKGGLVVYQSTALKASCKTLSSDTDRFLTVHVTYPLGRKEQGLILVNIYIPPGRKNQVKLKNLLVDHITQLAGSHPLLPLLVTGDFNMKLLGGSDTNEVINTQENQWYIPEQAMIKMVKQCNIGTSLVGSIELLALRALNGRFSEDIPPSLSFYATNRNSLIDFMWVSLSVLKTVSSFKIGLRPKSDHLSQEVAFTSIPALHMTNKAPAGTEQLCQLKRIKWTTTSLAFLAEEAEKHLKSSQSREGSTKDKWEAFIHSYTQEFTSYAPATRGQPQRATKKPHP